MPARGSPYAWPWPVARKAALDRAGWLCEVRGPTCTVRATTADHIVPVSQGGDRLAMSNLQAACRGCQTWRTHDTRRAMREPSSEDWYGYGTLSEDPYGDGWCRGHNRPVGECGGSHSRAW